MTGFERVDVRPDTPAPALRHANPAQVEAARRWFARHPRPADRQAAFDREERKQDSLWEQKGGNA